MRREASPGDGPSVLVRRPVTPRRRGAVIFDRDGVLNEDVGFAHRFDQITWVEGAVEAVRTVNAAGLHAFVATNQSGVARGFYDEADVRELHRLMNADLRGRGAWIDAFAYSPFHPAAVREGYRRDSRCRKPGPGMIEDLMAAQHVDPARTAVVGDRPTDVEAAHAAGVEGLLFRGGDLLEFLRPVIARLAEAPSA